MKRIIAVLMIAAALLTSGTMAGPWSLVGVAQADGDGGD